MGGRGEAGEPERVPLSNGVGVDIRKEPEKKQAGQALMWQAGNKFLYSRAKSSQPAKHLTAGSFVSDPQSSGNGEI